MPLTTAACLPDKIHAAIGALVLAQEAVVQGDMLACYSRIRAVLEHLQDAKAQIDGTAKN